MNAQVSTAIVTEPQVWFITGCSTGFGLELAKQAIEHGHRTVMTARDPSKLEGHGATDTVLVLQLDVIQPNQVAAAVKAAEARLTARWPSWTSCARSSRPARPWHERLTFLAQRKAHRFEAAAVWLHGAAAARGGPGVWAHDLPARLPSIVRRLPREAAASQRAVAPQQDPDTHTR